MERVRAAPKHEFQSVHKLRNALFHKDMVEVSVLKVRDIAFKIVRDRYPRMFRF